jgi:hypothetical protein
MKARIQQPTSSALPRTPCSPSSIPETDATWEAYQVDSTSDEGDPWGLAARLERERDEARERADTMFAKHANILDEARNKRDEARGQRDRLIKSVEPLKYWRDISECDCSNPLPQGGCLRCDLNRILKTTNPNDQ